jgi:tetratricopeptide (TPR) repeat protein
MNDRYKIPLALSLVFGMQFTAACGSSAARPSLSTPTIETGNEASARELFDRGVALSGRGYATKAEQYLALAALRGYPEHLVLPRLLRICLASSRLRAALNHAEPYLIRHPDDWLLRYLVASIYVALEKPARARRELERVVVSNPRHAPAHYLLAIVLRDAFADPNAAARHFNRYLLLAPDGDHALESRAWLRENPDGREATDQFLPAPVPAVRGDS